MNQTHEGGCLCGKSRYKAIGNHTDPTLCHCETCQKASGAPVVAWISYPDNQVEISGPIRWFDSSEIARRGFCEICGTPLFYQRHNSGEIDITTTTMDQPDAYPPLDQLWVRSKRSWMELASLPAHDMRRKTL